jgi:hypothetical protein
MNGRSRLDLAVLGLGVLALVAPVTALFSGDWDVFRLRGAGIWVTLALGLLGVVLGWLGRHRLALAVGLGFLVAAAVQILQLGGEAGAVEHGVLGGTAATFALWLGLGAGFTVVAITREEQT